MGHLSSTVTAKLSSVEAALKDNVTKVVKSKVGVRACFTAPLPKPPVVTPPLCSQNTTDAIGRAAAEAMQGPIQTAYKDTFQSIVLPVFERGCQSMFQQINDSFKQGTQECKAQTQKEPRFSPPLFIKRGFTNGRLGHQRSPRTTTNKQTTVKFLEMTSQESSFTDSSLRTPKPRAGAPPRGCALQCRRPRDLLL